MLSPVRLSSVCNVRAPYSAGWNFRQFFFAIWYLGHPLTSTENFTEIVAIYLRLVLVESTLILGYDATASSNMSSLIHQLTLRFDAYAPDAPCVQPVQLRPLEKWPSIVMSTSLCVSVCPRAYLLNRTPLAVARSSSGGVTKSNSRKLLVGGPLVRSVQLKGKTLNWF